MSILSYNITQGIKVREKKNLLEICENYVTRSLNVTIKFAQITDRASNSFFFSHPRRDDQSWVFGHFFYLSTTNRQSVLTKRTMGSKDLHIVFFGGLIFSISGFSWVKLNWIMNRENTVLSRSTLKDVEQFRNESVSEPKLLPFCSKCMWSICQCKWVETTKCKLAECKETVPVLRWEMSEVSSKSITMQTSVLLTLITGLKNKRYSGYIVLREQNLKRRHIGNTTTWSESSQRRSVKGIVSCNCFFRNVV